MIGKALKKEVLKHAPSKKGFIDGVDSPYQWKKASKNALKWETEARIGTRRKV